MPSIFPSSLCLSLRPSSSSNPMDLELQNGAALEVSVSGHRNGFSHGEESDKGATWRDLVLAYKTLGVVFGGLVTSPTEEDYLGIYSIIFWTPTLIGVVKYVCIALNADDHGEGGTFALYSLLCRHTNIGILPSKRTNSKADLSHPNQSMSDEKQSWLGKFLEQSITTRRIVLFIAMLGMCMLIGDGIFTPAISVLSAMDGLTGSFSSVRKSAVEALSAVILIVLFLLQKFGTSRISFLFSPIMAAWTFTTPIIGIYSFLRHYPGIFKTLSPHHIVSFFLRKGKTGWQLLGGTVLCITGAEAMFADLGHFNKDLFSRLSLIIYHMLKWFTLRNTQKAKFTLQKPITFSWFSVLLSYLVLVMETALEMPSAGENGTQDCHLLVGAWNLPACAEDMCTNQQAYIALAIFILMFISKLIHAMLLQVL